ncbi:MAG: GNAT family N-acetyltransferase [Gammaproteobacteria bacterium]|nr:GNAT family N-acetyltransferase [Pseudomonadales bacterium]MCP5345280.1 GNAT family N-acetyltransferase [Pseudomonadales bacterium]
MNQINRDFRETCRLADGTDVVIRPILPEDADIEWEFVHGLSAQSRYYRFCAGTRDLTPAMVSYFTHIDFSVHMALIAVIVKPDGKEREIAVGRYFKLDTGNGCEFAIVVDDRYQGLGVGHRLMELLIEDARTKGYAVMEGEVVADNRRMLDFVRELGFRVNRAASEGSLLKVELSLA